MQPLNHRHVDALVEQCVHVRFGQLVDGTMGNFYHVVARQLVTRHEQTVAQGVLLAKNCDLFLCTQRFIHLGIRYSRLAQTAIEAFLIR